MKRYLIIALLALVLPISLKAQIGPILGVEVEKEIVKNFSAAVEAEYRWQDAFKDTERISGSFGLDYKVNKYFKFGASYALLHKKEHYVKEWKSDTAVLNYWQNRHRFNFYVTGSYKWGSVKFSLRERFQYTMWDKKKIRRVKDQWGENVKDEYGNKINETYTEGRYKPVLRSRFMVEYDKKKAALKPYVSVEFFNLLNPQTDYDEVDTGGDYYKDNNGEYKHVAQGAEGKGTHIKVVENSLDRIRYSVGVEYKVAKNNELKFYYNYNDNKNSEPEDNDVKHQIGIAYKFSF